MLGNIGTYISPPCSAGYQDKQGTFGMNEKTQDIIEEAQEAFWFVIAASHPHIKTGDFSPADYIDFNRACERAVECWIASNQPASFQAKE